MKKVTRFFAIAALAFSMVMVASCGKDDDNTNNQNQDEPIVNPENLPTTLEENFDNGIPTTWENIDADGDGWKWMDHVITQGGSDGEPMQAALSGSYINTAGPLNPDNYLVTPKMYIEKGKKLTYTVAAYDDDDFAEKYDVLLGTVENGRFNTVATISTETLSTREQQNREFSLDQWAGQSLSIAFRHYDCTNMYFIIIDNVKVQ